MASAARAITWGASISAIGAAVQLLLRRWKHFRSRRQFDGLDGVVSFSSRLIAAARAIESMRADALFIDPFAKLLAGPKALARFEAAKATASATQPEQQQQQQQADHQHELKQQQQQPEQQQHDSQEIGSQPHPQQQQDQQVERHEGRQVSRLVLRTVFFDDATLLVTGQPAPRSDTVLGPVAAHIQQHRLSSCRQVVMLGAGMDTRPWRLPLDPQLKWFELDRQDVLAAKQAALRSAGAALEPCRTRTPENTTCPDSSHGALNSNDHDGSIANGHSTCSNGSNAAAPDSKVDGVGGAAAQQQHPLRVGCWVCASADLQQQGWSAKLQASGLETDTPMVWAAEGLLYYLEPSTVGPMLKEASSISPPGSMIIANFITADGLHRLHGARQAAQAAANTAPDTNSSSSNASSTGTAREAPHDSSSSSEGAAAIGLPSSAGAGNAQPSSDKGGGGDYDGSSAGADTAGAVDVGGVDAGSSSSSSRDRNVRKAAAEGDLHKSGLTSHFKWGCPDNVEEFFAECGWQLLVRYSLSQGAAAYGWTVQHTAASRARTDSQEVQYVVGVVKK